MRRHDRQKKHLEDVDGHCRKNKSKKDQLKGDEIDLISNHDLFKHPQLKATPNNLGFEKVGKNGNQFDDLINGWVAYWNDVFKTDPPLHPNFVKALMATESGFNPKSIAPNKNKKIGFARGLMQVTERTQRQLAGDEKELKDHLVILDDEEVWDPNKNICAGVRWLFRKREILKSQIKRDPTWKEVLMGYKGKATSQTKKNQEIRNNLSDFFKKLGG
ncbi:MAG: transglycosylase SLT domain-containing protein [Bacteriovorax sp.]|nr:transglycosylase SLT domain-containing protein [Bacteriovorax sp.]